VKLDGVPTGSKTQEHQIRFSYSQSRCSKERMWER